MTRIDDAPRLRVTELLLRAEAGETVEIACVSATDAKRRAISCYLLRQRRGLRCDVRQRGGTIRLYPAGQGGPARAPFPGETNPNPA